MNLQKIRRNVSNVVLSGLGFIVYNPGTVLCGLFGVAVCYLGATNQLPTLVLPSQQQTREFAVDQIAQAEMAWDDFWGDVAKRKEGKEGLKKQP